MKRIVASLFLLSNIVGPALADCVSTGHTGNLTATQIQTLLAQNGAVYACYNPSPGNAAARENNEALMSSGTTGNFSEYHTGGSTQENPRGTYSISTLSSAGVIKYTYTGGKGFTYNVCTDNSGTLYNFVNASTQAVYPVYVTTGPGTC